MMTFYEVLDTVKVLFRRNVLTHPQEVLSLLKRGWAIKTLESADASEYYAFSVSDEESKLVRVSSSAFDLLKYHKQITCFSTTNIIRKGKKTVEAYWHIPKNLEVTVGR